jgi:hypothetical protein
MNTIPQRVIVKATPCRWKHLRGHGTDAIYRASCGTGCPGHLGDLHFVDNHFLTRRFSLAQRTDPDEPSWEVSDATRARRERYAEEGRRIVVLPGFAPTWVLSASPLVGNPRDAIYRGYTDTGFKISFGGKRASNGTRVGRRNFAGWDVGGPRISQGQTIHPPARIWCPACGTLNHLEWPEPLRDCNT